ncbi:hypothetical protein NITHO_5930002 [Nitrolancea hollandica Lb]|uniref:Uncharacterized protein n=1 Tax=Nitrolancea hollandica Lb TaxID=1129897 RepID=I4EMD2_9BACT|nr:hypothetical protein NITHO_5930002 [Nitrolancea hollandica Lb]
MDREQTAQTAESFASPTPLITRQTTKDMATDYWPVVQYSTTKDYRTDYGLGLGLGQDYSHQVSGRTVMFHHCLYYNT